MVTCLSLDNDGRHLMCGSRDTTSTIWIVTHQSGLAQEMRGTPVQTLYGHDDEVTCVAISWEFDVAISGSKVSLWLLVVVTSINKLSLISFLDFLNLVVFSVV